MGSLTNVIIAQIFFSFMQVTHPNILFVFTRLGNTWMHGVCSFGQQHQPFSLSLHLDSMR